MSEILEGTTADYSTKVHYAARADGQWFVRYQDRGPWGYRWGAWQATAAQDARAYRSTGRKARLPK